MRGYEAVIVSGIANINRYLFHIRWDIGLFSEWELAYITHFKYVFLKIIFGFKDKDLLRMGVLPY